MAGLPELQAYVTHFGFNPEDLAYLQSLDMFDQAFIDYLADLQPQVSMRILPEGTVFFPGEPILELEGPLIHAQLMESYVLNCLGFSIIELTLATRLRLAAQGRPIMEFGLRRSQGPIAALRAARAAQLAGFPATSNVWAAQCLGYAPAGTMGHSFIQVHTQETQAFERYAQLYGERTILLVDTYDAQAGIKKAAKAAHSILQTRGTRLKGIRIDSGDFLALSRFARQYFQDHQVDFLKIFVSSGLDEYQIATLLAQGAPIDGFGVGTRFAVSQEVPALDIVYKLVHYEGRDLHKTSQDKHSRPGRKRLFRRGKTRFEGDVVSAYAPQQAGQSADLLQPFVACESVDTIRSRVSAQLGMLPPGVKSLTAPTPYPVDFARTGGTKPS